MNINQFLIHLAKCTDKSLILVTSLTSYKVVIGKRQLSSIPLLRVLQNPYATHKICCRRTKSDPNRNLLKKPFLHCKKAKVVEKPFHLSHFMVLKSNEASVARNAPFKVFVVVIPKEGLISLVSIYSSQNFFPPQTLNRWLRMAQI